MRQSNECREAQSHLAEKLFPDGTQAANLRSILRDLTMPQKIIWGLQDQILPHFHALHVSAYVGLHLLPDVGHMPHYEAPLLVARLLRQNINAARREEV